jgi:hypothetical protein
VAVRCTRLLQVNQMRNWSVLMLGALVGCGGPFACTDVGCDDALVVNFDRPPTSPLRVEAEVAGQNSPAVFDCPEAARCPSVFFPGLVADQVTIRVTTSAGTTTQQFRPQYTQQYPNGRACGAVCRQASVTVRLPG